MPSANTIVLEPWNMFDPRIPITPFGSPINLLRIIRLGSYINASSTVDMLIAVRSSAVITLVGLTSVVSRNNRSPTMIISSISSSAAKLVLLNIIMVSDCIINYFLSVEILAWTTPI